MSPVRQLLSNNNITPDSLPLKSMDATALRRCATRPFRFLRQIQNPQDQGRFMSFDAASLKLSLDIPKSSLSSERPGAKATLVWKPRLCPGGRWVVALARLSPLRGPNREWYLVVWDLCQTVSSHRSGEVLPDQAIEPPLEVPMYLAHLLHTGPDPVAILCNIQGGDDGDIKILIYYRGEQR